MYLYVYKYITINAPYIMAQIKIYKISKCYRQIRKNIENVFGWQKKSLLFIVRKLFLGILFWLFFTQ